MGGNKMVGTTGTGTSSNNNSTTTGTVGVPGTIPPVANVH
jgi:hypothetical protein